jgi:hypothetical protein
MVKRDGLLVVTSRTVSRERPAPHGRPIKSAAAAASAQAPPIHSPGRAKPVSNPSPDAPSSFVNVPRSMRVHRGSGSGSTSTST